MRFSIISGFPWYTAQSNAVIPSSINELKFLLFYILITSARALEDSSVLIIKAKACSLFFMAARMRRVFWFLSFWDRIVSTTSWLFTRVA